MIGRMKADRLLADHEEVPRLTQPSRSGNPTEALGTVGKSDGDLERAYNEIGLAFECDRSEARTIDLAFCEAGYREPASASVVPHDADLSLGIVAAEDFVSTVRE